MSEPNSAAELLAQLKEKQAHLEEDKGGVITVDVKRRPNTGGFGIVVTAFTRRTVVLGRADVLRATAATYARGAHSWANYLGRLAKGTGHGRITLEIIVEPTGTVIRNWSLMESARDVEK